LNIEQDIYGEGWRYKGGSAYVGTEVFDLKRSDLTLFVRALMISAWSSKSPDIDQPYLKSLFKVLMIITMSWLAEVPSTK
jgi:hypothetical protein